METSLINFKKQYRIELAPTLSGHYYGVWEKTPKKEKFLGNFVSVTTVLQSYPFSEQLVKWVAEKGFHESREIRDQAGQAGTRIHLGVEALLRGEGLHQEAYKLEEWNKLSSFVDWYHKYSPEIISLELPVFSKKLQVAGRADCIARINNEIYVIDWKSSRSIHPSYYLQLAAYTFLIEEMTDLKIDNTAILQMGASNKDHYRFALESDWQGNLEVFKAIQKTWVYDNKKQGATKVDPPILILPTELKL